MSDAKEPEPPDTFTRSLRRLGRAIADRFPQPARSDEDTSTAIGGCLRPSVLLGAAFLVASFFLIDTRGASSWQVGRRFDDTNAVGATANAAEKLVEDTEWPHSTTLFIIGLLLLIFARLGDIVHLLDERKRQPPQSQ